MSDQRENAGVVAPPPLIYAVPLLLGLVLNRRIGAPFLPSGATRVVGVPLLVGGLSLGLWFMRTLRGAGTPVGIPTNPSRPW